MNVDGVEGGIMEVYDGDSIHFVCPLDNKEQLIVEDFKKKIE